jgi:hypothetical protein
VSLYYSKGQKMDIEKINELLIKCSQSGTQSIILIKKIEGDSDIVYEIDYKDKFKFFRKRHEIFDPYTGEGWCILSCHKLKRRFIHFIQTPNKFSLVCRACQIDV